MTSHQRARSTVAATLLSLLVLTAAVLPAPRSTTPSESLAQASQAVRGTQVLVTGAAAEIVAAIRAVGGAVLGHIPLVGAVVADVPVGAVDDLGRAPGVTAVVEDSAVELHGAPHDSEYPADDDGPRTLGADKVWQAGHDGSGVGIAVVDTGVSEVADLAGRVVQGVDLTPEQDHVDHYGHGTLVAAAAAGDGASSGGQYTGTAPGAHVVPVKIAGADGNTTVARLLIGLDWVARHADTHDIRVVNVSLGSAPAAIDLVDAAVQRLWDLGLVVVVAAGNNGPDTMGTPAANTHVMTVGATRGQSTKRTSDDVAAPWSTTGVDADGNAKPDVTAPGQSLVLAGAPGSWAYDNHPAGHIGNGYQRVSGTSFSAGLLSGAAALAADAHPSWTPDEVLGQLLTDANDVAGTDAPTPWLPKALRTDDPATANLAASPANLGATPAPTQVLADLGPVDPLTLGDAVGSTTTAITYGVNWHGVNWHGVGPYSTTWFGVNWHGVGWFGVNWHEQGWYGQQMYGVNWHGVNWHGVNWHTAGWS